MMGPLQHVARLRPLLRVVIIHQLAIPSAQRDAQNVEALAFERENFPPDETVADLGILVDEIGDF
jgi:hypothetical protein